MTKIWDLPVTDAEAVSFFQERGILSASKKCARDHEMELCFGSDVQWRCPDSTCDGDKSIFVETWCQSSRLSFLDALRFIYSWSKELTSVRWCEKQLEMGHDAVVDWNNYIREVCVSSLVKCDRKKIGGPNLLIEIDESIFTKQKNTEGEVNSQQWIFGGICRESNEYFLILVPNRSLNVLLEAMKENIREGSTIYSDTWKNYCTTALEEESFQDFIVNHKYIFVDSKVAAHTLKNDQLWGTGRWRNKIHRGTDQHYLESYFAEFMWRRLTNDPFEKILDDIKDFWPLL